MNEIKNFFKIFVIPIILLAASLLLIPVQDLLVQEGICEKVNTICSLTFSVSIVIIALAVIWLIVKFVLVVFFKSDLIIEVKSDFAGQENVNNETMDGFIRFLGLRIINNTRDEITDCYGTLESIELILPRSISPGDNNMDYLEFERFLDFHYYNQFTELTSKRLKWKNSDNQDCKISIAPKPKSEILQIIRTQEGFLKTGGMFRDIRLNYCSKQKVDFSLPFGLYRVKIRIDGKRGNKSIQPVFYDGYIYSIASPQIDGKRNYYFAIMEDRGNIFTKPIKKFFRNLIKPLNRKATVANEDLPFDPPLETFYDIDDVKKYIGELYELYKKDPRQ